MAKPALRNAGWDAIERHVVPFPTSRQHADGGAYREHYVEQLATLVASWRRRRLLRSPGRAG